MRKILKFLSVITLALTVCFSASGCVFVNPDYNPGGGSELNSIVAAQSVEFIRGEEGSGSSSYSLPDAVEKVSGTSVAIEMTSSSGSGSGSGVIVDVKNSGNIVYIVTCHHVISSGGTITVYVPDENDNYDNKDYIFEGYIGAEIYADKAVTLVGGDNVSDIAVIKINLDKPAVSGNKLSVDKIQKAVIPSSDYKVRKGEPIFAIGNPLGELPGSVADGVVSFPERKEVLVSEVGEMNLMQISVTTNPGNSGGGLYNLKGELIGITNAGNTNYDAINFAIPTVLENGNGFVSIASQLIATATETNYGYISGRWSIGITVNAYNYRGSSYVQIKEVVAESNAALAGLKADYLINAVSWNGENYTVTPSDFPNYVALMRTQLKQGDNFTVYAMQASVLGVQNIEITVPIVVANYIFCDTGK